MTTYTLLAMLTISVFGQSGGVVLPDGEPFRERAAVITQGGSIEVAQTPDNVFASFIGTQLPPSDKGQFHIVVYADSKSQESRLLLLDFERHPSLKALRDWGKFVVIDRSESPASEARHMAAALQGADIPTVLVMAHPEHPRFGRPESRDREYRNNVGWQYAFAGSGYGGDAALLARNIYDGLRQHYQDHGVSVEQCPGPYCPDPRNPDRPSWPPRRPNAPNPGWEPPRLPQLDGSVPTINPFAGIWPLPGWVWAIVGAIAVILLLALSNRMKGAGVLLLCATLCGSAIADEPVEPAEPAAVEATEPVEEAYLYPPLPQNLEWLDSAVRDEVRRAIDPPRIESWLRFSLNSVEVKVDNALAGVNTAVQEAGSALRLIAWITLLGHAVTVGAVVYLVYLVRQWG